MTLYDINSELNSLIDYETGEVADFERFQELTLAKENKREAIALVYKNAIADKKMYEEEIKNLTEKKKRCENIENRMKEMLAIDLNGEKFKTSKVEVSFRPSESTEVINIDLIPKEYIKTKTEVKPDLTAIKEAIKNGIKIDGARIIEKVNIQIK